MSFSKTSSNIRTPRSRSLQLSQLPLSKNPSLQRSVSNSSCSPVSNGPCEVIDNVRVCARFRPLNRIEEEINSHFASAGLKDSTFECSTFPDNVGENCHTCVNLHVPEGMLLAAERFVVPGSGGAMNLLNMPTEVMVDKDIERFVNAAVGIAVSSGNVGVGNIIHNNNNETSSLNVSQSYKEKLNGGENDAESFFNASQGSQALYNNNYNGSISHYKFTFSRIFSQNATQNEIYQDIGAPLVQDILQGYNGTIFVYGQTGSGKTYTMMGAPKYNGVSKNNTPQRKRSAVQIQKGDILHPVPFSPAGFNSRSNGYNQEYTENQLLAQATTFDLRGQNTSGIIPRVVQGLFDVMYASPVTTSFTVTMYFVEIYMEHVRDLLVSDTNQSTLNVREDPKTASFFVEGCLTPEVTRTEEILELLEFGIANRVTASTKMNIASSRSHCLLCLNVKSYDSETNELRTGKLSLVDLAGSEKVAKTRAEGQQLEEAKIINKSLTSLGQVITSLTEKKPRMHIPYRDSKLTKILMDALGGNSKTTLVVCCSPSVKNAYETLSTLRFGQRAKAIKNKAVINKELSMEKLRLMLDAAQREIEMLKSKQHELIPLRVIDSDRSLSQNQQCELNDLKQRLEAMETTRLLEEVRFDEERKNLITSVHNLEDQLVDVEQSCSLAIQTRIQLDEQVQSLRQEKGTWEENYNTIKQENKCLLSNISATQDLVQRQYKEAEEMTASAIERKKEVNCIKQGIQEAIRMCKQQVDAYRHKLAVLEEEKCEALRLLDTQTQRNETGRESGEGRRGTLEEREMEERERYLQEQLKEARQLSKTVEYDKATIVFLKERLSLVEKQRIEFEASLKEILNENSNLNLELQLLTKRMAIRTERVENLKQGMRNDHKALIDMRARFEGEIQLGTRRVVEARNEVAYWKEKCKQISIHFNIPFNGEYRKIEPVSMVHVDAGDIGTTPSRKSRGLSASPSFVVPVGISNLLQMTLFSRAGSAERGSIQGRGMSLSNSSSPLMPSKFINQQFVKETKKKV